MNSLCEAFQASVAARGDDPALRALDGSLELSWTEYGDRVRALAGGLYALGVRPGDTVALMTRNRLEFAICDTAALHLGAAPFCIYATSSPEQINHVLTNAGNRVLICESVLLDQVRAGAAGTGVETIISMDGPADGVLGLDEVSAMDPGDAFDFEASWRAVGPEDLATLIYTSGTTGPSKGVELTHANLIAQVEMTDQLLPIRPGDRSISYLPLAHIADRWVNQYMHTWVGHTVTYVPDATQLPAALVSVRPTVLGLVPRIWEKFKGGLEAAGVSDPSVLPEPAKAAVRERMGFDQVKWTVSGAAPIPSEVLQFFLALGLRIQEVWGMSELSCCVTVNPADDIRIGTVGKALPGIELKLAEDGEVLVHGATTMRGYRGQPEQDRRDDRRRRLAARPVTSVEIDADGYLKIVDRKKELIINAAGKNMSPANDRADAQDGEPADRPGDLRSATRGPTTLR